GVRKHERLHVRVTATEYVRARYRYATNLLRAIRADRTAQRFAGSSLRRDDDKRQQVDRRLSRLYGFALTDRTVEVAGQLQFQRCRLSLQPEYCESDNERVPHGRYGGNDHHSSKFVRPMTAS